MTPQIQRLADEFNRYFTSANSVDVPAKVSVSRDEWRLLYAAICSSGTEVAEAVAREREACATVCEGLAAILDHPSCYMGGPSSNAQRKAQQFAAAIRDRDITPQQEQQ